MKLAVIRLVLALVLFAGWIGYLGYQVWTRPRTKKDDITSAPLVLSRPQILGSEVDIIGDVPAESNQVTVTVAEVLSPPNSSLKPGDKIQVLNTELADSEKQPPLYWSGPGRYLLLLRMLSDKKKYELAAIPPSPGFPFSGALEPPVRLYPDTPAVRAQYNQILEAKRKLKPE
jgi:hypothetical protein